MNYQYKGRYQGRPMPIGCLYLNNSGSKWVTQDMRFYLKLDKSYLKLRLADYYESFGNFGLIVYRHRGTQYKAFASDTHKNGITIVEHKERG